MNISDFQVSEVFNLNPIKIMLPKEKPFRVDPKQVIKNVLLVYRNGWWLVHPKFAKTGATSKVCVSDLYLGVFDTGEEFVIPVTRVSDGKGNSISDSLITIVEAAKEKWVIRDGIIDYEHQAKLAKGIRIQPRFESDLKDCFSTLFENRTLNSDDNLKPKSIRFDDMEEFE